MNLNRNVMNQLVFMDRTLFITIKSENPRPSNKKFTLKNRERGTEKKRRCGGKKVMTCAYT